jgi:hypothetical protein
LIVRPTSHAELGSKLVRLVEIGTAHLGAQGGCPEIEGVGHGSSSSGRVEDLAGAPLADGVLVLLPLLLSLELLGLLLALDLGKELSLVLLSLNGLDAHHLELEHLHLSGLGHHILGGEARAERHAVGVHATGSLMLGEAVVGSIYGGGHGNTAVVVDVLLGHVREIISLILLWEDVGGVLLGKMRDAEGACWGCGMGYIDGGGADAACAETGEKRGTVVGVCGSHCFGGGASQKG